MSPDADPLAEHRAAWQARQQRWAGPAAPTVAVPEPELAGLELRPSAEDAVARRAAKPRVPLGQPHCLPCQAAEAARRAIPGE